MDSKYVKIIFLRWKSHICLPSFGEVCLVICWTSRLLKEKLKYSAVRKRFWLCTDLQSSFSSRSSKASDAYQIRNFWNFCQTKKTIISNLSCSSMMNRFMYRRTIWILILLTFSFSSKAQQRSVSSF